MRIILNTSIAALMAASLAACGGSGNKDGAADQAAAPADVATTPTAAEPTTVAAADAAPAKAADGSPVAFGICKSCHSVEKGKTLIGPSLFGIVGTKAGEVPGFAFSPALKASGLTWDDATLDKWLENPLKLVPGTRMTYAGQTDPAKRQEIIAYLKTLK